MDLHATTACRFPGSIHAFLTAVKPDSRASTNDYLLAAGVVPPLKNNGAYTEV